MIRNKPLRNHANNPENWPQVYFENSWLVAAYGVPVGAYLLPMFYIPFIALVAYRLPVALIVALLAPPLNFLLTGNPQWGLMGILTIELVLFTLLAYVLMLQGKVKWIAAPLAYLGA